MREKTIEQHLNHQVEKEGGVTYKFISTQAGVPDRIVILYGVVHLVELKAPTGKLTRIQQWQHDRILRAGVEVVTLYSKEEVDAWVASQFL